MNSVAYIILLTAAFGVIPALINSVYEQNQYLKKLQKISALRLSQKQLSRVDSANTPIEKQVDTGKLISIQNEKGETELRLKPEQLLYVASEGNYLDVFYLESNSEVQRRVVRNRLKSIISSVGELSVFAVHRSYAINLQHLREIKGNARAAKVYLHGVDQGIPVARSKFSEIKNMLESI
jgi:DNA-binding LytR/AlgR family response regulator